MLFEPAKIKGFVTDLDGTLLLPNAALGEKTVAALREISARGRDVFFATGRSVLAAETYRKQLGFEGPQVYYNGAALVDMPRCAILCQALFPVEAALFCVALARERGLHFHVFFVDDTDASAEILMAENPSQAAGVYTDRTGLSFQYGDLERTLSAPSPPPCAKGLFIAEPERLEEARAILRERFGDTLNMVKSAPMFLEILHRDATKGNAVLKALELRGLAPDEVIVFGDEENDLSMFKAVTYSAAPSSAKESVKRAARMVIGPCAEEGVAAFLTKTSLSQQFKV